jgi:hypothetical protein
MWIAETSIHQITLWQGHAPQEHPATGGTERHLIFSKGVELSPLRFLHHNPALSITGCNGD